MQIRLHKLARTTPAIRQYIWNEININKKQLKILAIELNLNVATVSKWSKRDLINNPDELYDRSHAKHNLNLLLNPKEEEIIIFCRQNIGLSILDICMVLHSLFAGENITNNRIIKYSKNSIYACIKRHKVKTPLEIIKIQNKLNNSNNKNKFDVITEPGFIHIDFKYLPRIKELNPNYKKNIKGNKIEKNNRKYLNQRSFLFSAIDRYSRYVYAEILTNKSVDNVVQFLKNFIDDFEERTYNKETNTSLPVKVILTDNGGEFTDRYAINSKLKKQLNIEPNKPSGQRKFDKLCKDNMIEHRLTKPYNPLTNGMIENECLTYASDLRSKAFAIGSEALDRSFPKERFNGRIAKALKEYKAFKGEFKTQKEMFDFILTISNNYNKTSLQCLHYKTPLEMLDDYNNKCYNQVGKNT